MTFAWRTLRRVLAAQFSKNFHSAGLPRATVPAAELRFGQPVHETHPHILSPGELTPGITAFEYAQRRARLAESLPPNSVAVVAAANLKYRSGSVFYKFHQEPNFFYLTGFNEPDAIAVIEKSAKGTPNVFHLYVRPNDPAAEQWEGSRSGVQAAQDVFNADESGDVRASLALLQEITSGASHVFTDIPREPTNRLSTFTKNISQSGGQSARSLDQILSKHNVEPLQPIMNGLRVIKSDAEIANMRKAGQASGRAFTEAMRRQWTTEKDVETFLEYQFKMNGCEESAYVPVVAGGANANQIHYVRNDAALQSGELVTVDAGGEYGGYVTDITRSWPINGSFGSAQRDLYEVVLGVQRKCISLCREDAGMTLDKLHDKAEAGLADGLKQLGFDLGYNGIKELFPHHLGHYVGLDIHDAPGYQRTNKLVAGNCITVEPGLYIDDNDRWPPHFRGTGIRIEDSICVQNEGPLVLTTEAVKEIVDIEALRR